MLELSTQSPLCCCLQIDHDDDVARQALAWHPDGGTLLAVAGETLSHGQVSRSAECGCGKYCTTHSCKLVQHASYVKERSMV